MGTARHRVFGGLNERQEYIFQWIGVVVVLLYVTAWIGALHEVYDIHRQAVDSYGWINELNPMTCSTKV